MITDVNKKIFESNANLILNAVDCNGEIIPNLSRKLYEAYPHVEKEYMKYIRKCTKNKFDMLSTVQYIPVDTWALPLVDTLKNERVEAYDTEYHYIVNCFVQETFGKKSMSDIIAIERTLKNVKNVAEKINASVAVPFHFGCGRNIKWHEVQRIIHNVFDNSNIDVEICKGK